MSHENLDQGLQRERELEQEITEALALLGRWSHLFVKLDPEKQAEWRAIVAKAQGSQDRIAVRNELDRFIEHVLKPRVERLA